jgi:hypothetical protein
MNVAPNIQEVGLSITDRRRFREGHLGKDAVLGSTIFHISQSLTSLSKEEVNGFNYIKDQVHERLAVF